MADQSILKSAVLPASPMPLLPLFKLGTFFFFWGEGHSKEEEKYQNWYTIDGLCAIFDIFDILKLSTNFEISKIPWDLKILRDLRRLRDLKILRNHKILSINIDNIDNVNNIDKVDNVVDNVNNVDDVDNICLRC